MPLYYDLPLFFWRLKMKYSLQNVPFALTHFVNLSKTFTFGTMKKCLSILIVSLTILCLLPSCRKCFTCQTTCYACILRDSTGAIVDHQNVCSDSVKTYKSQKATLQAGGYNCSQTKPNYSVNYCVNTNNGSDQYMLYYEGNGRYSCKGN